MSRLSEAKTELERYEQTKPGAYESAYTGRVNDRLDKVSRLNAEDTSGMTEEELEKHAEKTKEAVADMLG